MLFCRTESALEPRDQEIPSCTSYWAYLGGVMGACSEASAHDVRWIGSKRGAAGLNMGRLPPAGTLINIKQGRGLPELRPGLRPLGR